MQYLKFRIQNFKGIKDTTIDFSKKGEWAVFSFVGLNESGKTTILEAIHSFNPDKATGELLGIGADKHPGKRVPRHKRSTFAGNVSVTATIKLNDADKEYIIRLLAGTKEKIILNEDNLPDEITLEKVHEFERGDFQKTYYTIRPTMEIKSGRQQKYRSPSNEEEKIIQNIILENAPSIAYFPTFVFDFPSKIFLTEERGDKISKFYREVFQDILDFGNQNRPDNEKHTIEESIVRRIRNSDKRITWTDFIIAWGKSDDKHKVQHIMDCASADVTKLIFGEWNKIFSNDARVLREKNIEIPYDTMEGQTDEGEEDGREATKHDIFIEFEIRDGTQRFKVSDRSLGFRWFFAFMLFTQFRIARENTKPILFLIDEPASNLHASAQQRLIESFPGIACNGHMLAYTTHSHRMIDPKWLGQTFVVINRSDSAYSEKSIIGSAFLSDESLDIQAIRYKNFVNQNPQKTHYFQPILDRLDVVPSKFDIERRSIIVEGPSDYYILKYAAQLLDKKANFNKNISILPAFGAGTYGPLISLHLGWGLEMLFLLDSDKAGKREKTKYEKEYGVSAKDIITLNELHNEIKEIEDVLDKEALNKILEEMEIPEKNLSKNKNKKAIQEFFNINLASNNIYPLSKEFKNRAIKILNELSKRFKLEDE